MDHPINAELPHEPLNVHMLDGWQFVKCSCGQNPVPHLWVAEHWDGDRTSGEAVLRALIAEQNATAR